MVMRTKIPDGHDLRCRLLALPLSDMDGLSKTTKVPLATLLKLRHCQTGNPRVDTVRALWPHLSSVKPKRGVVRKDPPSRSKAAKAAKALMRAAA